jgi:methyl-accepting chemotaxis protein
MGKVAQHLSKTDLDTAFEYIQNVQKSNKDSMEALIITDANGKVVIDSDTKEPDIDLSNRNYMKKALSSGSEAVSEVLTSRFTGNPAIFIVYPLKDGDKIIGTLVGSNLISLFFNVYSITYLYNNILFHL